MLVEEVEDGGWVVMISRGPAHRPRSPPEAPFSPVDADNENSIVPLLEPRERPEDVVTLQQVGETNREADLMPPSFVVAHLAEKVRVMPQSCSSVVE